MTNESMNVRKMLLSDMNSLMHLKNAEKWNQREKDWQLLIEYKNGVNLVAELDNKVVGSITGINYANKVAWIGMMLVEESYRGKGISKRLLNDTIELLKNLVSENKIEIVGTAKYHPILPLIPKKEAQRQIQMNEETNRKEFGRWDKKGFFPPELAISGAIAKIIRQLGYKWVIMSGIACPIDWPYDKIYTSPNGLQLFFRDDILSNKIAFNYLWIA